MENASMADAVIANRGLNFAGTGYGYGGHGGSYGREFANDGSNAVRIEAHSAANAAGIENLLDQNQFSATNDNIVQGHNRITDNINLTSTRQSDMTTSAEFRTGDRLRDLEREMNANARVAAECCCETKLLAVQNQAKTDAGMAQILANQACDTRVGDAVSNAQQNAKLDAILAERSHGRG